MAKARTEFKRWGMRPLIGAALLVISAGLGCSRPAEPVSVEQMADSTASQTATVAASGVAIIDVNKIADECGALAEINRELDKREAEFNLILEGLRKIHLEEVAKQEKELGDDPTPEQQEKLTALRNKQAADYHARWQNTRVKLSAIKQRLDDAFLSKLRPIAKQVAEEKGLNVVLRNENVFCLVDHCDITADVTTAFRQKFPPEAIQPVVKVADIPSRGGGFEPRTK